MKKKKINIQNDIDSRANIASSIPKPAPVLTHLSDTDAESKAVQGEAHDENPDKNQEPKKGRRTAKGNI